MIPYFLKGVPMSKFILVLLGISYIFATDVQAQSRQTPNGLGNSIDVQRILDTNRKAEDLRRAVALADGLAKQLNGLANDIAASSPRSALLQEANDARSNASKLSALDVTRASFSANSQLFSWRFGISAPLQRFSGLLSAKSSLQRIQDLLT
jgi:hypothetical protein